jgi:ATP citrate (pro-S)-lyase
VSLLWFRRQLPDHCLRFIELAVQVCADHGPAVSGAHNTIVAARAGKDLVSSLCSGLLTIGPRFGGALDDAAKMFTEAADAGVNAKKWVTDMKKENKLIMGIGHRIKSKANPDTRVEVVKAFALKNFDDCKVLKFALDVEEVTTAKKANLILNVDGCIAVCFVDMLRSSGALNKEEIDEAIADGCLNGLFVMARTIGLIGHFLDQKRMKQPLYRHPWDDITYVQ